MKCILAGKQSLRDGQLKYYEHIKEQLLNSEENIDIYPYRNPLEINEIIRAILADTPQLFWFDGRWSLTEGTRSRQCIIKPDYSLSKTEIREVESIIDFRTESLVAKADLDEISKAREAYLWIINNIEYGKESGHLGQTMFDAMVLNKAVCRGLAKTYQYLLYRLGVKALLAEGCLDDRSRHVWNYVLIADQWYHVDVCMGYECLYNLFKKAGPPDIFLGFLKSDRQMRTTHFLSEGELFSKVVCNQEMGDTKEPKNEASKHPYLLRIKTNEKIYITKPCFTIGRDVNNTDYAISDNHAISRYHAIIQYENGNYYIKDNDSRNSTFVNGARIQQTTILEHGCNVQFANEKFEFKMY